MILDLTQVDNITDPLLIPKHGNTVYGSVFLLTGDGATSVLALEASHDLEDWTELTVLTDYSNDFTPQEVLPYKYIRIRVKQASTNSTIALVSLSFSDLLNITLS